MECAKPDVKETKSQALQTVLRLGEPDDEDNAANSISISIRTSKATAIKRPPTMKRFIRHETVRKQEDMDWEATGEVPSVVKFAPLIRRTDLYVDTKPGAPDGEDASNPIKVESQPEETDLNSLLYKQDDRYQEVIEDDVQYGYKYGSTYIPAPSDSFDQLGTKKGLDIIGFIPERKVSLVSKTWIVLCKRDSSSFVVNGQWARYTTFGVIRLQQKISFRSRP